MISDLTINKTVNNSSPAIGNNVTFTITVGNNGPDNDTGVIVNDLLPSGYTFVSASPTVGSYNSTTGVWNIGNLNVGQIETLNIVSTVLGAPNDYINGAAISGDNFDSTLTNNTSFAQVSPIGVIQVSRDFRIQKSVSNPTPVVGTNVTFTLVASLAVPPITSSTASVNDLLPPGYSYVSHIAAPGTTYNPLTGVWDLGILGVGALTLTIVATVLSPPNNYINNATISGDGIDPNLLNNGASVQVLPTVPCPTITLSPSTLPNGQLGHFYNQFVLASGGTAPYIYTISAGFLPPGLVLFPTTGIIAGIPSFGLYNFTVTATDANGCTGSQAYTINVPPFSSGGSVVKTFSPSSVPAGTVSTLTISVFNAGTTPITGININDIFPLGLLVAPIPNVTNNMGGMTAFTTMSVSLAGGTILPGQTGVLTIDVISNVANTYSNNTGNVVSDIGIVGSDVEDLIVTPFVAPSLTTQANPTIVNSPGSTPIFDSATLSGLVGSPAIGSITFSLYGPDDNTCGGTPIFIDVVPTFGNGVYNTFNSYTPVLNGTYRWIANYSGDINNAPIINPCNEPNESVVVSGSSVTVSKDITPFSVPTGTPSRLTITVVNNTTNPLTNITFNDIYPTTPGSLINATPPNAISTMGGIIIAVAGGGSISFSGGILAPGTIGTVSVDVIPTVAGVYNNSVEIFANGQSFGTASGVVIAVGNPPTPTPKKRKRKGAIAPIICVNKFDKNENVQNCPQEMFVQNHLYRKVSDDGKQCCYIFIK